MAIADGPVRRIGPEERRSRLGVRHHLASSARAAGVVEVARDVIGLHATDPASVFLAAWARMQHAEVEAIEHALYEERSLLKMLGMRRTMFVVPIELVPVIQAACTKALVVRERVQLVQLLEEAGIVTDGGGWLRRVEEATVQALSARGQAYGGELSEYVPALREQMRFGEGTSGRACRASPPACSTSSPPKAGSPVAAPEAPGSAASIDGCRWKHGCPVGWPSGRLTSPVWSWSAAGWQRSGRVRSPT